MTVGEGRSASLVLVTKRGRGRGCLANSTGFSSLPLRLEMKNNNEETAIQVWKFAKALIINNII
jgi:hypothetical protein